MRLVDCATSSKSTGRKLYNAAHDLELDDVRTLLEGAETQAINWRHPLRGMTPLQVAVDTKCEKRLSPYQREEALQLIDTLLLAKANPDACGRSKTTALIVSAANGDLEVVKKLLKAGANPNHGARNAFDHGGFIAKITNENVYYSLLFTVWPRAARWTSSKACWTACHETAHNGYHEVLDALIDARADVNVTDADSQTPLHVAASMGNSKAVERIIHAGASLDARDVDGETPLMLTVSQGDHTDGHVTACRLLVEAKADVEAIDNNLETVSTHAEHHNRHETAEMIETIFARMALKAAAETDPLLMNVRAVQRGLWTAEKKDVVPEDELVRCRARLLLARTAQAHSWEGLRQLLCTPLLSIECSLLERQIDLVAAERNTAPAGGELSSSSAQDERAPSMGVFGIDEWISQVAQGGLISPCNETSPVFRDPDEAEAVETLGHARSLLVEARNVQAAARQGDSCIFWFVKAENIRQGEGCFRTQLPSLQELREVAPDWIEARTISISDACSGRLVSNYTAVSHRWDDAQHPDPTGKQLESLRGFLVENPLVEFVWIE
jgi:ankyrin repeat protein